MAKRVWLVGLGFSMFIILTLILAGFVGYFGYRFYRTDLKLKDRTVEIRKLERQVKKLKAISPKVQERIKELEKKVRQLTAENDELKGKVRITPEWLPLYPGFEWTSPHPSRITRPGDQDFESGGMEIISSRQRVDSKEVEDWYARKLPDLGYKVGGPAGGAGHWGMWGEKGSSKILILYSEFGEPGTDGFCGVNPHGSYLRINWK